MIENQFRDITNAIQGSRLEMLSKDAPIETVRMNEAIDYLGRNTREFGINDCKDDAKRIFTPEVLATWSKMSLEQRKEIVSTYGNCVAKNFELVNYQGIVYESLDGKNGFNTGDGVVHLSKRLINGDTSPLQIVDTLTHELRHQYQLESIGGYHYIPDETRREWKVGLKTYTTSMPWAEDPWGYKYNPLEMDARYAGESVVREFTKDFINSKFA